MRNKRGEGYGKDNGCNVYIQDPIERCRDDVYLLADPEVRGWFPRQKSNGISP